MLDAVLFEYPVLHLKLLFIGYENFNLNVDVMFKVFVKGCLFESRCMIFQNARSCKSPTKLICLTVKVCTAGVNITMHK